MRADLFKVSPEMLEEQRIAQERRVNFPRPLGASEVLSFFTYVSKELGVDYEIDVLAKRTYDTCIVDGKTTEKLLENKVGPFGITLPENIPGTNERDSIGFYFVTRGEGTGIYVGFCPREQPVLRRGYSEKAHKKLKAGVEKYFVNHPAPTKASIDEIAVTD